MTPSTPATCKFCGTVALPNDEQNCSSLDEAYRQTPTRPYGCPWFDKDARKANPAPVPSTPASTDAGALADMISALKAAETDITEHAKIIGSTYDRRHKSYKFDDEMFAASSPGSFAVVQQIRAALRNSAQQETRGGEPVGGIEDALRECISVLELVERPAAADPDHGEEIEELGMRIGFGALMTSASASWRAALETDDCPTGGEFVAGPCLKTVVVTLAKARAALAASQPSPRPDTEGAELADLIEHQHGIKIVGSLAVDSKWAKGLILAALRRGHGNSQAGEYLRGYAIGLHDGSVASQPSPRLEREGVAQKLNDVRCARRGASLSRFTNESSEVVEELLAQADAILALLSPDTTVVSSISQAWPQEEVAPGQFGDVDPEVLSSKVHREGGK